MNLLLERSISLVEIPYTGGCGVVTLEYTIQAYILKLVIIRCASIIISLHQYNRHFQVERELTKSICSFSLFSFCLLSRFYINKLYHNKCEQ